MTAHGWTTVRRAWTEALYGPRGFYRAETPADHFTTSSHVSPAFAKAVASMARGHGATTVIDLGAGEGELLAAVHAADGDLRLIGVDLRPRPHALPAQALWSQADDVVRAVRDSAAARVLVLANELLDNVPCDLVELDAHGSPRIVEVNTGSGEERLGDVAPDDIAAWLRQWWPLTEPGERAAVGLARDRLWNDVCASAGDAVCIAIDYGHVASNRPPTDGLVSYRRGRLGPPRFDGRHDVTAHVAVDSVAAAVGGSLLRQRDALGRLGVSGARPLLGEARADPRGYLSDLAAAAAAAELMARPGLGDFWWVVSGRLASVDGRDGSMDPSWEVRT